MGELFSSIGLVSDWIVLGLAASTVILFNVVVALTVIMINTRRRLHQEGRRTKRIQETLAAISLRLERTEEARIAMQRELARMKTDLASQSTLPGTNGEEMTTTRRYAVARNLARKGVHLDQISRETNLSPGEIKLIRDLEKFDASRSKGDRA